MSQGGSGVLGHLRELRTRLIWCLVALAIASAASFFLFDYIMAALKAPAGQINLVFIEVTEGVSVYMKVCLVAGAILASPFIIYQTLMFILPALTRREKKMVLLLLPWVTFMFLGGVAFGYFVLIPPATQFLLSFGESIATPQLRVGNYVTFVARLLLTIGLIFELPVVTTALARMGLVSWRFLARQRRVAIVLAFVLAAVLTPTIDPVNQILVTVPLIILYEAGIWLARLVQRPRAAEIPAVEPG